jgi:hypothetical protein
MMSTTLDVMRTEVSVIGELLRSHPKHDGHLTGPVVRFVQILLCRIRPFIRETDITVCHDATKDPDQAGASRFCPGRTSPVS